MWNPPNTGYRLDPQSGVPVISQYDLSKLPPDLRCPCGSVLLQRLGSGGPPGNNFNVRCQQCAAQFILA